MALITDNYFVLRLCVHWQSLTLPDRPNGVLLYCCVFIDTQILLFMFPAKKFIVCDLNWLCGIEGCLIPPFFFVYVDILHFKEAQT